MHSGGSLGFPTCSVLLLCYKVGESSAIAPLQACRGGHCNYTRSESVRKTNEEGSGKKDKDTGECVIQAAACRYDSEKAEDGICTNGRIRISTAHQARKEDATSLEVAAVLARSPAATATTGTGLGGCG